MFKGCFVDFEVVSAHFVHYDIIIDNAKLLTMTSYLIK